MLGMANYGISEKNLCGVPQLVTGDATLWYQSKEKR